MELNVSWMCELDLWLSSRVEHEEEQRNREEEALKINAFRSVEAECQAPSSPPSSWSQTASQCQTLSRSWDTSWCSPSTTEQRILAPLLEAVLYKYMYICKCYEHRHCCVYDQKKRGSVIVRYVPTPEGARKPN